MPDTDIRTAFAPLRDSTPTGAEIAALRARVLRRHPVRRRVPIVAGLAAAVVAVATLPLGGGASASELLRSTAAVAADQPGPDSFTGYRYAQSRVRWTFGTSTATVTVEQPVDTWLAADWSGKRRAGAGSVVAHAGDSAELERSMARSPLTRPSTAPFQIGDGALARVPLASLPTDPDDLARLLDAATRDGRWSPSGHWTMTGSDPGVRYMVAREALTLLTVANATPQLRAALFGVLAAMPDVVSRGEQTDALGRHGEQVEIRFPASARGPVPADPQGRPLGGSLMLQPDTIRVLFDPDTSDILSWSVGKDAELASSAPTREVPQLVGEEHLILRSAHVTEAGDH